MKTGIKLTLNVLDLGEDGDGVAKVNENFCVYVPHALPGEKVSVLITESYKTYAKGKLLKIFNFSPLRVKTPCGFVELCGGCQIQQMKYSEQLILKKKIVENCLKSFGVKVEETLPSENVFRYRNKALIPVSKDVNGNIIAGIYKKDSHEIISCPDCKIGIKENEEIIKTVISHLKKYGIEPYDEKTCKGVLRHVLIRKGFFTGELMVSLIVNALELPYETELVKELTENNENIKTVCITPNLQNTNVINGKEFRTVYGGGFITDYIGSIKFKISPLSFFQINPKQTVKLYEKVLEFADLTGKEPVFDLYCGVGTISLFLAQKAQKVYGVEIIPQAIENAKENAAINGISNAEFLCGNAGEIFNRLVENQKVKADVVVVDPPRKGCEEELLKTVLRLKPKKFVYVSCNPVSLARDLKFLTANGFVLEKVQPADMFPHTAHVETVCLLTFSS
ncbi:MAG: 23S rRNA (uracil(1939)-C(5))-methyltransferase RlmD [Bacteroidales bacterium]|nr:23S rRNA (uracil(1939)-C(5))-methyltransferase RlmD [Bacteroidales bacterium]